MAAASRGIEIADQTGGLQVDPNWDRSLGDVFQTILREYRHRYIISFTPTGVGSGDGGTTSKYA